jgi:hypothetical protein
MSQANEATEPTMPYEEWKAQAVKYAWETYTLPADCVEDDMFRPYFYERGATPESAIDEHCEDCDIQKTNGAWGIGY